MSVKAYFKASATVSDLTNTGADEPRGLCRPCKSGPQSERRKITGMPFKSKAQRRKFAELLMTGKISDQTYEEWNRSTGSKTLPERIHPNAGRGSKSKKRTTSKTKTKKAGSKSKARKR